MLSAISPSSLHALLYKSPIPTTSSVSDVQADGLLTSLSSSSVFFVKIPLLSINDIDNLQRIQGGEHHVLCGFLIGSNLLSISAASRLLSLGCDDITSDIIWSLLPFAALSSSLATHDPLFDVFTIDTGMLSLINDFIALDHKL